MSLRSGLTRTFTQAATFQVATCKSGCEFQHKLVNWPRQNLKKIAIVGAFNVLEEHS